MSESHDAQVPRAKACDTASGDSCAPRAARDRGSLIGPDTPATYTVIPNGQEWSARGADAGIVVRGAVCPNIRVRREALHCGHRLGRTERSRNGRLRVKVEQD